MNCRNDGGNAPDSGRRTILVVDDAYVNRAVLKKVLSTKYIVAEAENGVAALRCLRTMQNIAAIILDIMMPEMDGHQVLGEMRKDDILAQIPVVVVTDSSDEESQLRALEAGAQEIIIKPYSPQLILRRVENILARRDAMLAAEQSKILEEQLYLTSHDNLTGLLNRTAFTARVREAIDKKPAGSYVLSCLDIDNFKVVNDRFGHAEGDRLLKFVAETRQDEVEQIGGIACREMADVFLTLLPNDEAAMGSVTDHFFNAINAYGLPIPVEAHIGRYTVDEPTLDVNLMIDRAMLAMRAIKNSANDRVGWFDDNMLRQLLRKQELVDEMRPALAAGQFVLYFQPQYDYAAKTISGAEALVRWLHPEKGLISPDEFIPLFEENGFITNLDLYVWEQACKYLQKWSACGLGSIPVSVNVSRRDIRSLDLPETLTKLVNQYGLEPRQLQLEITESAYVDQPGQLIEAVKALQSRGFVIEMDDFGSGYSSLNTLKDVPVDILKLDMQFCRETDEHSRGGSILSSVVRMAHWLKLAVIAEGVESERQAEYLKSIGCYLMQGYLFFKPMPADAYENVLRCEGKNPLPGGGRRAANREGAVDFLDASTQATLLFNSFVGGAQIVEYDGKRLESLRANDRFFEVTGMTREEYVQYRFDLFPKLYRESGEALRRKLETAADTGEETQCEIHSLPTRKGGKDFWTETRIRFLARNGQHHLFYLSSENITGRKELDAARQQLDDIVRNVPAGIAIYAWGERITPVYISDRACNLFGFTRREYEQCVADGKPLPFMPTENFLAAKKLEELEPGNAYEEEYVAQRRDGGSFWLRSVYSVVKREDSPPLIYTTLVDVTAQHESSEELRCLIDCIPGGLYKYALDDSDRIAFISDSMLQMLGYTRQEFSDKFHDQCMPMVYSEDVARVQRDIIDEAAQKGAYAPCEYRIETKNGGVKWVLETGRVVQAIDGNAWVYAICIDIDEKKRLEQELAAEASRYEAMIKNSPGGVIVFAVRGDRIDREYMSEGVARMLGCEAGELPALFGNSVYSRVHPEDRECLRAAVKKVIRTASAFSEQYRLKRKDGRYIWVNTTGNPAVGQDGVLRFYNVYADITQQMLTDEKLRVERQKTQMALSQSNFLIWEYDIQAGTSTKLCGIEEGRPPLVVNNIPDSLPQRAFVDPATAGEYVEMHRAVAAGTPEICRNILLRPTAGAESKWMRVTYHTVFLDGKPVSAIGSAVDVDAEVESRMRARETELAMEASALYFWTYDYRTGRYQARNESAKRLDQAYSARGKQNASSDAMDALPEGREEYTRFVGEVTSGREIKEQVTLHLDGTVIGVEWLKANCALVRDDNGAPVTLAIVGEDVTGRVRAEQQYKEEVHRLESLSGGTIRAKIQANLTRDSFVVCHSRLSCGAMRYSEGITLVSAKALTDKHRERILQCLGRERLLAAFAEGKTKLTVEYQLLMDDHPRPRWMRTVASVYRDPVSGDIMTFQHVYDADDEITKSAITDRLTEKIAELLALIYPATGLIHYYHQAALTALGLDNDEDYSAGQRKLVARFVAPECREKADEQLSLETIVDHLNRDGEYKVTLPGGQGKAQRWKQWAFFWQGEEQSAMIMICSDVTDVEALRRSNTDMRFALQSSDTVICHYDAAKRTLTMPDDYAHSVGLSNATLTNVPYSVKDITPGDEEAYKEFYESILRGVPQGGATLQFMLPGGRDVWIYCTFRTNFNEEGVPIDAVVTIKNVTEQHEKDMENQRSRILIEQNNIAIIDYDFKNDVMYFEANRVGQGLTKKAFPGYYDYIAVSTDATPEGAQAIRALLRAAAKQPTSGTLDYQANIWGTGYRWVCLNYSTIADESGKVYRLLGQVRDIQPERDREKLLEELRAHIGAEMPVHAYNPAIIAQIFQYLYGTSDTDAAIERVLALLGTHFGVSRAYICEDDPTHAVSNNTFEWCAPGVEAQKEQLQGVSYTGDLAGAYARLFDGNGLCLCRDIRTLPASVQRILEPQGVRGIIMCNIMDGGDLFGMVGFDDCVGDLTWTEELTGTLSLASMILGTFLIKRRRKKFAALSEDFVAALDDNASYIYIINPETHEIVYGNKALRTRFADVSLGVCCYEAAAGKTAPCENCPIRRLEETNVAEPVEILRMDGVWMLSQANRIHWNGRLMYMISCTDITAQKRMESVLRTSAEENEIVIRQSGKYVFLYDIATGTAHSMVGAFELLGLPRIVKNYGDTIVQTGIVLPESVEGCRDFFRGLSAGKPSDALELRLHGRDASDRWYHIDSTTVFQDGKPDHAIISFYDCTEQREKEQRLKIESALSDVVRNISGGVYSYRLADERRMDYISDSLCEMIGYTRDETLERFSNEIAPVVWGEDTGRYREMLEQLAAEPQIVTLEYRVQKKTGEVLWVSDTVRSIRREDGVMRAYGSVTEIDQVHAAQMQLRALADSVPGGIIMYEYADGKMTMRYFNDALCRITGYSREEYQRMAEQDAWVLTERDDIEPLRRAMGAMLSTNARLEHEYRIQAKNGLRWINITAEIIDRIGDRARIIAVLMDVTARREGEEKAHLQEEAYRIAVAHVNSLVYRYDIKTKTIYMPREVAASYHLPSLLENVPQGVVDAGYIAPECEAQYIAFYQAIDAGRDGETVEIRRKVYEGKYRWFRGEYTTIRSKTGQPVSAIVTFTDIESEKRKDAEINTLRESERLLRVVAKHSKKAVVLYDFASDTLKPYLGEDRAPGDTAAVFPTLREYFNKDVIAPESLADMKNAYDQLRNGRPDGVVKFRAKLIRNQWEWYDCAYTTIFDSTGKVLYAILSLENITEIYEKELAFKRYRGLMSTADRSKTYFLEYNLTQDTPQRDSENFDVPGFTDVAKKGYEQIVSEMENRFVYAPDKERFNTFFSRARLLAAFANGTTRGKTDIRVKKLSDSEPVYVRMNYQMISDPYTANILILFSCRIVDDEVRAELALKARAQNDAVTGLLNRVTFIERVQKRLKTADPGLLHAFAMLDIDHFKRVNDTYGHVYGDKVLYEVARTVKSVLFKEDLVGRLGGDEFGLLIGGFPDMRLLEEKLSILRMAIYRDLKNGVRISGSIGVALYPGDGHCFEELYKKADMALYQGKERGRDRCVFYRAGMRGAIQGTMLSPIDGDARAPDERKEG